MSELSRRDLLRASAGAAALAVPITALSTSMGGVGATGAEAAGAPEVDMAVAANGPVMFCIHDAARGEVSILQGADEVIVHDRQLVGRIMKAASQRRSV